MARINHELLDTAMRSGLGKVFPAACLLVALGGETLHHATYGYLDPDKRHNVPQTDTIFDLASLTKLFTFTLVMRLIEAGRVGLETPLAAVIPEFDGIRPIGPAEEPLSKIVLAPPAEYRHQVVDAQQVTFRHLLTHTSGLAAWRSVYRAAGEGSIEGRWQRALKSICNWDFYYPPGARIVYSDLGFMLLGEAVARLTGRPFEASLEQYILRPLGLAHTGFRPVQTIPMGAGRGQAGMSDAEPEVIAPTEVCTVRGYRLVGEVDDENCAGLGGIAGHAGLFATAADLATLCCVYSERQSPLLNVRTITEMTRTQVSEGDLRRGLGWVLAGPDAACGPDFGPRSFGHTGFTGTSAWVDPDRHLTVILLTNRVYYGRQNTHIAGFRPALHSAVIRALEDAS